MSRQRSILIANEFFHLYGHKDGGCELVEYAAVEIAPVNERHGAAALNIGLCFNLYARQSGVCGASVDTGYRLHSTSDTVRGPDPSFVHSGKDEWENLGGRFASGAPDIAVEVFSPSNTTVETERKVGEYLAAGSQRDWVTCPSSKRVQSIALTAPPSRAPATTRFSTRSGCRDILYHSPISSGFPSTTGRPIATLQLRLN